MPKRVVVGTACGASSDARRPDNSTPQHPDSGETTVVHALFEHGDSAVVRLVDCIDRSDLAAATLAGKHVTLGVMCGMALQRIASATEYEDASDHWAGVIDPTATPTQLREAKKAWQKVIAKRTYKVL